MKIFYTYLWLRANGIPFYVGKGTGRRAFQTDDHYVKCPKDKLRILVQEHPTEQDALEAERFFIAYYGRKDLGRGPLRNITDGGDRGPTGMVWSEIQKQKLRKPKAPRTAEHCKNLALALTGKKVSEATRRKQSESATRRFKSSEERLKASIAGKLGAAARWGVK